jgi:hypothetical protein
MAFYSDDKPVRGKRTPAHIDSVPTLLNWFPEAKIAHILRDPRADFVSRQTKIGSGEWNAQHYRLIRHSRVALSPYLAFAVVISWRRVVRLHHQYQRVYQQNYCLVLVEYLIGNPRTTLNKPCACLEIGFAKEMLQQTVVQSSTVPHDTQIEDFDTSAIDRWCKHLDPLVGRRFTALCSRQFLEFGYRQQGIDQSYARKES